MNSAYIITSARERDIRLLAAIELAAARLLIGHAPDSVLKETTSRDVLKRAQRDGHLWVALADDVPVGFAHVEVLESQAAHLEEIDVSPERGRRGLGTRLVSGPSERTQAVHNHFAIVLDARRALPLNC
jgi:ribosomal protein S18 acetylase RimI-like enzyme